MKVTSLYRIGLLALFPIFVAIHGAHWIISTTSFVISVYAMKLVLLPFLVFSAIFNFSQIINERRFLLYVIIVAICFALSTTTPFITGKGVNFYYFTDMLGLAITITSIFVIYAILKNQKIDLPFIEKTSVYYLIIISFYILFYYFLSGGSKISITPEMQIPMAIMFGAFFFPIKNGYKPPVWVFFLVFIGCYFSLLRENVIVFAILAGACMLRRFMRGHWLRVLLGSIGYLIAAYFVTFFISDPSALYKFTDDAGQDQAKFDDSITQRFIEIEFVLEEMQKVPLSLLLGQGFGATYENISGYLVYYGQQVHNVHSTPAAVYLRNGLYGVLLYFSVFVCACVTIFSRNRFVFRTSLCLVVMYATLFFNQYLYWNVQYGLAVALWLYSLHTRDSIK